MLHKRNEETARVIERSIELIEKGWCRHAMAKNKHGRKVEIGSNKATNFCLAGAITRSANELHINRMNVLENIVGTNRSNVNQSIVIQFNDQCKSKKEVIDKLTIILNNLTRRKN